MPGLTLGQQSDVWRILRVLREEREAIRALRDAVSPNTQAERRLGDAVAAVNEAVAAIERAQNAC